MARNPYTEAITRWSIVVLGIVGATLSVFLLWKALSAGTTDGCFSRYCMPTKTWTAQANPTQFCFYVLFWAAVTGIFGRVAWKAWRS